MTAMIKVLIVEDERVAADNLRLLLSGGGYEAECVYTFGSTQKIVATKSFRIYLVDVRLPDGNGLDLISRIRTDNPDAVIVVLSAYGTIKDAVSALKSGADHYLIKPIEPDELLLTLKKEMEHQEVRAENIALKTYLSSMSGFENLIGKSETMTPVFERIRKLSDSNATVLISGESVTGKELVARTLHYSGSRREKRFVAVHCAAIPEALLESELFGYVKGAYTGALHDHMGRFEYADKGTILLDEVGELTPSLQVKLLRVLQERKFERLGSNQQVEVDVRILASTNRNLSDLVAAGEFREDLYWRLNVVEIHMPPLRERKEDIALLAKHFLGKYAASMNKTVPSIRPEVLGVFNEYPWPGNVRELENVLERAVTLMEGDEITVESLPTRLRTLKMHLRDGADQDLSSLKIRMKDFEKKLIEQMLQEENGNRIKTAERLHISLRALQYKLKEYGI